MGKLMDLHASQASVLSPTAQWFIDHPEEMNDVTKLLNSGVAKYTLFRELKQIGFPFGKGAFYHWAGEE